jgi:hypothetical protein
VHKYVLHHEDSRESGGIAPRILNLIIFGYEGSAAKEPPVSIGEEIGWTPEPIWMWGQREESLNPAWNRGILKLITKMKSI